MHLHHASRLGMSHLYEPGKGYCGQSTVCIQCSKNFPFAGHTIVQCEHSFLQRDMFNTLRQAQCSLVWLPQRTWPGGDLYFVRSEANGLQQSSNLHSRVFLKNSQNLTACQ